VLVKQLVVLVPRLVKPVNGMLVLLPSLKQKSVTEKTMTVMARPMACPELVKQLVALVPRLALLVSGRHVPHLNQLQKSVATEKTMTVMVPLMKVVPVKTVTNALVETAQASVKLVPRLVLVASGARVQVLSGRNQKSATEKTTTVMVLSTRKSLDHVKTAVVSGLRLVFKVLGETVMLQPQPQKLVMEKTTIVTVV